MPFVKGECANPRGRPKGSASRSTMRGISERVDQMIELQNEMLNAVARGDCPPFRDVGEAIGALEFISAGVQNGTFEPEAAKEHIAQLRAFIESVAASNFSAWQGGRRYL
jgi:hypothetical protein